MIERLKLTGVGVIEDAELSLGAGFIAITGETGAGKTMVLSGLNIVSGGKVDNAIVRAGHDVCIVECDIATTKSDDVERLITEAGGTVDEGVAIVSRTVASGGRGRATAGGRTVPVALLAELAQHYVVIHGQANQHRLRTERAQRDALDSFGGEALRKIKSVYQATFDEWHDIDQRLTELSANVQQFQREAEFLNFGLEDIARIDPQPDEDVELDRLIDRAQHQAALAEAARDALQSLGEADERNARTFLDAAIKTTERAAALDPKLAEISNDLAHIGVQIDEQLRRLLDYAEELDGDGRDLDALEQRRYELNALKGKYGPTLADVRAWQQDAADRLGSLDASPERLGELTAERDRLRTALDQSAKKLSAAREKAGRAFATAVAAELSSLAMPNAVIAVDVTTLDQPLRHGRDQVVITLAGTASEKPRPVTESASGGELSRIMLAIEVVLAANDATGTMVFDEVDAGVGGAAAVEIGKRLSRLAKTRQVIVVTHLPQVAVFADQHVVVHKDVDGEVTAADVREVTGADRLNELARMMSGFAESQTAQAHAQELLQTADEFRATGV